eukprot:TRINITY_DN19191_c0_g1_i2.p1 TRINITY_DN19191_c0_g1~~TRINITY_DN19191_c0_g1_i2.p1  ORF type:complete len:169 (-),score=6.36 TRINITY_DN19191_c0_g1_i2:21-506(-)
MKATSSARRHSFYFRHQLKRRLPGTRQLNSTSNRSQQKFNASFANTIKAKDKRENGRVGLLKVSTISPTLVKFASPFRNARKEDQSKANNTTFKEFMNTLSLACNSKKKFNGLNAISLSGKENPITSFLAQDRDSALKLSLIHICRCRRYAVCRSRWSPYH